MPTVDESPQQLPPLKPEIQKFVASLLENSEVEVFGGSRGAVGKVIHNLFSAAQKVTFTHIPHGGTWSVVFFLCAPVRLQSVTLWTDCYIHERSL